MSSRVGKIWVLILFPSLLNCKTISALNFFPPHQTDIKCSTSQGWKEKMKIPEKELAQLVVQHKTMLILLCVKIPYWRQPISTHNPCQFQEKRGLNQETLWLDQKTSNSKASSVPSAYFQIALCFLSPRAAAQQGWTVKTSSSKTQLPLTCMQYTNLLLHSHVVECSLPHTPGTVHKCISIYTWVNICPSPQKMP